jgi:septal ring factor EnvC (AmiA/AmiB activator)
LKATKAPTAPNKVEEFAKKLRADMEAQERVLNVFIKTIKDKHANTESKLKTVKSILKGLKDEINNATKYANAYQSQDTDLSKQDTLYKTEYDKSYKMYLEEQANIKFEKQFLDAILQYIKLRKTQKC